MNYAVRFALASIVIGLSGCGASTSGGDGGGDGSATGMDLAGMVQHDLSSVDLTQSMNPDSFAPMDLDTEDLSTPVGADLSVGDDLSMMVSPDLSADDLSMVAPADLSMADMSMADLTALPKPDLVSIPDLTPPSDLTPPADLSSNDMTLNGCVSSMSCYGGPMGTLGKGVCKAGTEQCINGIYGQCTGEVDPNPESCNGLDDDCNGLTDDGLGTISCGVGACKATINACVNGLAGVCVPGNPVAEICGNGIDDNCNGLIDEGCGCVYVAPTGNDQNLGTAGSPKKTINAAIAAAGLNGLPKVVCVASGAAAPSAATYAEDVVMKNGVQVYGGYQAVGNAWPRVATCVTTIAPTQLLGVTFDQTIATQTILDGFTINAAALATSAAITITGGRAATVSNDMINGAGTVTSYGVNIVDFMGQAATPTITTSVIVGGNGSALAIGVLSTNSAPIIQNNCGTYDNAGHCLTNGCFANVAGAPSIHGRLANGSGAETYGVRLTSSPGAIVDSNAVCGEGATASEAAVRLSGNAAGTVITLNQLSCTGTSQNAVGVWADPCNTTAPWVFNNAVVSANSTLLGGRADGVRSIGDCHTRVDSNLLIVGGNETANAAANGVYCAIDPNTKIASLCTVINNVEIRGSKLGYPPTSTGVHCESGACARIENNLNITARGGIVTYGVYLENTGTFVNANFIDAGCASTSATGIYAVNSFARIQNNSITGNLVCQNLSETNAASYGIQIVQGTSELDVDSNDIFGSGVGNATSAGVAIVGPPGGLAPPMPRGILRNNIIYSGSGVVRYNIVEEQAMANARIVQNNDLFTLANGVPTALYRAKNMTNILTIPAVNMQMVGPSASANFSSDPLFVNGTINIPANSPCVAAGTAVGAPNVDYKGAPRVNTFDVGMDQH